LSPEVEYYYQQYLKKNPYGYCPTTGLASPAP
jgi:peptide methionine sulfoxide reductase MsrA